MTSKPITYRYDAKLFARCLATPAHKEALWWLAINVQKPGVWTEEHVLSILKDTCKDAKVKMPVLYQLITGSPTGLPLPQTLTILGREWLMDRLFDLTAWETTEQHG